MLPPGGPKYKVSRKFPLRVDRMLLAAQAAYEVGVAPETIVVVVVEVEVLVAVCVTVWSTVEVVERVVVELAGAGRTFVVVVRVEVLKLVIVLHGKVEAIVL